MSTFSSSMITEAPWSRADTAAASPAVPAPMVTKSAETSQKFWASAPRAPTPASVAAPTPAVAPRLMKARRLTPASLRVDLPIGILPRSRPATLPGRGSRCKAPIVGPSFAARLEEGRRARAGGDGSARRSLVEPRIRTETGAALAMT